MTEIQTVTVETTMAPEVIEVYSGPRGEQGPIWHTGAFPPEEGVGQTNDLYLVSEGATNEGNVYKKSSDGTWVPSGNIRGATGGIQSINGKTGNSVIISAEDITSGVIGMSQMPTGTTAGTVALGNHNHDSVYEGIIPAGTTSQYFRGDKTWQSLSAAAVGLGNVNNTSDLLKPISTATQTALNNKTDKVWSATGIRVYRDVVQQYFGSQSPSRYFIIRTTTPITSSIMLKLRVKAYGYGRGVVDGWFSAYMYNNNGGTIHGPRWSNSGNISVNVSAHSDANNNLVIVLDGQLPYARVTVDEVEAAFGGVFANESYFQGWTVENTDTLDGLSAATTNSSHFNIMASLDTKQNEIPLGTTSQFYRGDKTWQPITKSVVGLGNVDNTSDLAKPISTATAAALAGKVSNSGNEAIGGTKTFSSAPVVPNNSFTIAKVNGLQAALDSKVSANSPSFTGTVSGITKDMVGLPDVDNTSDLNKPISTAVANALLSKAQTTDLDETNIQVGKRLRDGTNPLAALYAALARRNIRPVKIAFIGDSITYGLSATADKFRFVDQLTKKIQYSYPSAVVGYYPNPQTMGQVFDAPPRLPGVHSINGGIGGTTSANYVGDPYFYVFGAVDPDCYIHMVGYNDSLTHPDYNVPPEDYYNNINASLDSLDGLNSTAGGTPACHVLIHTFRKNNVAPALWAQYGDALRTIADNRSNVLFIDMSEAFGTSKIESTDPYKLMGTDLVHPTDEGHAMMADIVFRKMGLSSAGGHENSVLYMADTFSHTSGTPAALELPANKSWTVASGTWAMDKGKVTVGAGRMLVDAGSTDFDVSCVINVGTGPSFPGILWRASAADQSYATYLNVAATTLSIYRISGFTATAVASAEFYFAPGLDFWVRTIVKGDKVSAYLNGTHMLDYTIPAGDSFNNNTKIGLGSLSENSPGLSFRGFAVRRA